MKQLCFRITIYTSFYKKDVKVAFRGKRKRYHTKCMYFLSLTVQKIIFIFHKVIISIVFSLTSCSFHAFPSTIFCTYTEPWVIITSHIIKLFFLLFFLFLLLFKYSCLHFPATTVPSPPTLTSHPQSSPLWLCPWVLYIYLIISVILCFYYPFQLLILTFNLIYSSSCTGH